MKNKKMQIEGLRAIGTIMILLFHYLYRYFEIYGGPLIHEVRYWGNMGCVLFFMISGFFVYRDDGDAFNLKKNLVKRIYKLWGPYVVAISLIFLLLSFFPLEGRTVGVFEFICNILMFNGFIGINYVDGAHWYLTYLLAFTGVACCLKGIKKHKNIYLYIIWLFLNVLVLFIAENVGGVFGKVLSVVRIFFGGDYAGAMVAGILLRQSIDDNTNRIKKIFSICCCIIFTMIRQNHYIAIFMILSICILYMCYKDNILFLQNPVLVYIGTMSYYIYLIHQNIGYVLLNALSHWMGIQYYYVYLIIVVVVIGCLSMLIKSIWKYIEVSILVKKY